MKRVRVMWAIGALMCVVSILLLARPIDVFDRDDQAKPISQSAAPTSPPTQETTPLAETEIALQPPVQLGVPHLDAPAQNSPHAILPDAESPAVSSSPTTETKSPATADAIPVAPSQAPKKDEFVMLIETATIRNGPSDSADIIGRAHPGARARVASRDSNWSQIVDPASGKAGWVDSSLLAPSAPIESAANEEMTADAPDAALDRPLDDQGSQRSKMSYSASKSRHAAKARHHGAYEHHGRRRFAFRLFFRGFLR